MKKPFCLTATALLALLGLSQPAAADLILDGTFTGITNQSGGTSQYTYGQWGNNSGATTGSVIKISDWDTAGYNFVYSAATAAAGTHASGANSGIANEAPGQYNNSAGYGTTYIWGSGNGTANSGNGGLKDFSTNLFTGNFVASDAAFQTGAINQTVNGLVAGREYQLTFYWGAAQEDSYNGTNVENWKVSLGNQSFTTPNATIDTKDFSGWMKQTFTYTASNTSETLSFLAQNAGSGEPPFVLLGGVSMIQVPEPSTWAALLGLGAVALGARTMQRRRQACQDEASQA